MKLKIMFITLLFFLFTNNVDAKLLTINELEEEFPKTNIISELKELGSDITINNDKENNQLKLIYNNKVYATYNYNNEFIEYDNRTSTITEETAEQNFVGSIGIMALTMATLNKLDYNDMFFDTKNIKELEDSYNTYGLQILAEDYQLSVSTGNTKKFFLRYYKQSLDSTKLDKLMEKYGVNIDDIKNQIYDLTPILQTEEITDEYIKLYVKATTFQNQNLHCIIYKSNSLNGEYKELNQTANNCEKGIIITDNDIESGKTYYYKAILQGSNSQKFSKPVVVTIPKKNNSIKKEDNITSNPKTSDLPIFLIYLIGITSLIYSIIFFKKIHN